MLDPDLAVDERRAAKARERLEQLGSPEDLMQKWREEFPGATVLPIAARRGVGNSSCEDSGVSAVLEHVVALLPEHPPFYDKEQLTDRPQRFFAAEFLREVSGGPNRTALPAPATDARLLVCHVSGDI